jgi:hypothetical protein
MSNAARNENNVPTLIAVLNTDGETVQQVTANPTNNALSVDNDTTGSDNGPGDRALRDENFVTTLIGVSSVDGVTPVAVYANASGQLLIDSN